MQEKLKQKKGITLIALVITIIVLLILAGVSIAMLTGNNGILTQANNAKTQTEIGTEKEQLSLAVTDVRTNGLSIGENLLNKTNLQKSLDNIVGAGKTQVDGEGILSVFFTDSERTYYVTADAEILGDLNEIDQSDIYTYTEEGYITGVKDEYLKNNQDYGENGKYASTGNMKIATTAPIYYLVDELNGTLVIPNQIGDTKIIGIADEAFWYIQNLKQVIINDGIITIGNYVFEDCGTLSNIVLPESLQSLGESVFYDSNLRTITIPSGVTSIGNNAFGNCNVLNTILLDVDKGTISGEPWGAGPWIKVVYKNDADYEYINFANEYLSNKSTEELEGIILKSEMYVGTFEEYLTELGMSKEELEQRAEEAEITYDEILKDFLMNETSDDWVKVEYYITSQGWENKEQGELEQLFLDQMGIEGTFDAYLEEMGETREQLEQMAKDMGLTYKEFLKFSLYSLQEL